MDDHSSSSATQEQGNERRRTLRSHRERGEGGASDSEATAHRSEQRPAPLRRRSTRLATSSTNSAESVLTAAFSSALSSREPSTIASPNAAPQTETDFSGRGRTARLARWSLFAGGAQSRRGRDSAVGSPSRGNPSPTRAGLDVDRAPEQSLFESDISAALENGLLRNDLLRNRSLRHPRLQAHISTLRLQTSTPPAHQSLAYLINRFNDHDTDLESSLSAFERAEELLYPLSPTMGASSKRPRDGSSKEDQHDLLNDLKRNGAVAAMLYRTVEPVPAANDIWPNFRSKAKLPVRYSILDVGRNASAVDTPHGRPQKATQSRYELRGQKSLLHAQDPCATPPSRGRPLWQLPVELVEQIIEHLNRDDIKSLRLVSRELNEYTSQAAFKTVVVPFNTEIYGMLGQEPKADRKGKKRAKISRPEYWWKNANGDEIYNGHGLDVFRGFGRHILRYGMSFEVNEDALSAPPLKSVTEQKTSFWGNYEWPFEEYRRFDAVAGLESAADETPRMKTAFSELTRVKELALSVDSGLGWLNGPDRSIRARALQTSPSIFGTRHHVPDRRTQAQREFWDHIQSIHALAGEDVRLALLYRLEGTRPITEAQEAGLMATLQPSIPFLDAHVPFEATYHDANDALSRPLDDSAILDRHALGSPSASAGVLFTSTILAQNEAAQYQSPIVPASLSKAQKEWLLETEWAQRAFMSSYMLSIIDNPATFAAIHTLNISSLSDRYLPLLNRDDFWSALPHLKNVTLVVIPGWRTVEKDGAGFVETRRVDPAGHVDTFCALLEVQVAPRSNITNLTIGYAASGEHAEGLHARNKLLMPAPVMPLRASYGPTLPAVETVMVREEGMLRHFLLRFPYLEELTLRNCWVTPAALQQFVKVHDECALKRLTLDSVSLTAVLRPLNPQAQGVNVGMQHALPNAAAVQQVVGALWAHLNNNAAANTNVPNQNGQAIHNYIQALIGQLQQMQANAFGMQHAQFINTLHTQLQQHLQNVQTLTAQQPQANGLPPHATQQNQQAQQQTNLAHVTQLNNLVAQVTMLQTIIHGHVQNQNQNQNAPAAAPTGASADNNDSILQSPPREGSWTDTIDQLSPGTNLSDFGSTHSQADTDRATSLESISFISCGYAKLPYFPSTVDQTTVEAANGIAAALRNPAFTRRSSALAPSMLSAKWQYLGEIVQEVDVTELAVLEAGWNLKNGWDDAEAARAVEFDGLLSGGTGRFSGVVRSEDRVAAE